MLTVKNFSVEPYIYMSYGHLWFIPMLFWCFIFTRVQSLLPFSGNIWWKITLFIIFTVLHLIQDRALPLGLGSFMQWYIWFFIGYTLLHRREQVFNFMHRHMPAVTTLLVAAFAAGSYYRCEYPELSIMGMLTNLVAVALFWFLTNLAINNSASDWVKSPVLAKLNKYSYGIYVFHYWIQPFIISRTAKRIFGLEALANEHVLLFPFAFFVLSFAASACITACLLKTRVGRFLIG